MGFIDDDDDFEDEDEDENFAVENRLSTISNSFNIEALILAWQDPSPDNLYYFDTASGALKLVNQNLYDLRELTDELEKNKERYLYLPKPDANQLKNDLKDFQKGLEDENLRKILDMAFESPHIWDSFKVILKSEERIKALEDFRRARTCLRIRQWMEANAMAGKFQF